MKKPTTFSLDDKAFAAQVVAEGEKMLAQALKMEAEILEYVMEKFDLDHWH